MVTPSPQEHQEPRTIILRRARCHPSRGVVIPILGGIHMFYGMLSTTIREGGRRALLGKHNNHTLWATGVDIPFSNGARRPPLGDRVRPRLGGIHMFYGMLSTTIREGGRRAPLGKHNTNLSWGTRPRPPFSNGARRQPLGGLVTPILPGIMYSMGELISPTYQEGGGAEPY